MGKPLIECEVDTCTHWISGNLCSAANIDILHEEEGRMAQSDAHTECKSFARKKGLANMLGSIDNVNWGGIVSSMFTPGQQINPSVTCTVNSCHFWADGNLCEADRIKVTGHGAAECQDTNCATFANEG